MLKSIITDEAVYRFVLRFPTLVLSQKNKGHNLISFPKMLFSTNKISETATILVNFKLAIRILCLVFRKYLTIPIASSLWPWVCVWCYSGLLMKLNSFSKIYI